MRDYEMAMELRAAGWECNDTGQWRHPVSREWMYFLPAAFRHRKELAQSRESSRVNEPVVGEESK